MDRRKNLEQIGVACLETADSESIRELLGEEPGVIFECAGFRDALSVAISLIAPRGTIVATSVPTEPVPLPQWNLIEKEARIVTGVWYTRDEFEEAVRLLDTGEVPAHAAPVGVAPLIEAPRAMKELLARQSPHLKVLLQP
jgi:threonine dehydrogenase-like Zn-dependent dehydrogenase